VGDSVIHILTWGQGVYQGPLLMSRLHYISFIFLGGALALGSACGSGTKCGAGTVEQDGTCVPAGDQVTCATGTTLVGNECVPDGSVICEVGTTYDANTGTCVADITGCGPGTVEVGGECVTDYDALVADVNEPAEPNGLGEGHMPGEFDLPAVGDDVTIKGCITPTEVEGALVEDLDAYLFVATEPTLLDVSVAGFNGLAGGFVVLGFDDDLADDDWLRFGVSLVNASYSRQVYLPKAGVYALVMADSRSFFFGPAGDDNTCYYTTVERLEVPTPTAITPTVTLDGPLGDTAFYSYDASEGDLLWNTVSVDSGSAAPALTVLLNGEYYTSSPFDDLGDDAFVLLTNLSEDDEVVLVVDYAMNIAVAPVTYEYEVFSPGVQAAPGDGGTITVDNDGTFFRWLYFDAAAGDVVYFDYSATSETFLILRDANLGVISPVCPGSCDAYEGWFQFPEGGRFYMQLYDESETRPADDARDRRPGDRRRAQRSGRGLLSAGRELRRVADVHRRDDQSGRHGGHPPCPRRCRRDLLRGAPPGFLRVPRHLRPHLRG
jgi:hypothetical protein